ncbi:MAG: dTMP kinase [Patescibacteria group bacterium]|nr:dTMP kinase [Patescibacteria group bacterium]
MKKNTCSGKLIVFEGLDGAGGETQSKLLFDWLKKKKKKVELLTYPDYQKPIGKLIHQFLHQKYEFSPEVQFLLYFADFIKDKEKIEKWLKQGKIIISDRYFTSTIAYQGLKGFPLKSALKIAKTFGLPRPALVIYLKISPQTSIKRKFQEKKHLDRHEGDKKFLAKLGRFYGKLIKNQTFSKWQVINGERSIEEVFKDIKKIIRIYK